MILIPDKIEIQTKNIKKTSFVLYMKCFKYTLKIMQHNMMNNQVPSTQLMQILTLCHIYFRFYFVLFLCMELCVSSLIIFLCLHPLPFQVPSLQRKSFIRSYCNSVHSHIVHKGKNYKQYKVPLICILRNILATPYIMEIKNE